MCVCVCVTDMPRLISHVVAVKIVSGSRMRRQQRRSTMIVRFSLACEHISSSIVGIRLALPLLSSLEMCGMSSLGLLCVCLCTLLASDACQPPDHLTTFGVLLGPVKVLVTYKSKMIRAFLSTCVCVCVLVHEKAFCLARRVLHVQCMLASVNMTSRPCTPVHVF